MFSPGAAAAQSSACLRCQLRSVIQHLPCPPRTNRLQLAPRQHFSTVHRQRAARDDGFYYKHITPGGRIVGKPGRKQRQTSEPLAISSLGEQSEVVIFRDVIENRNNKEAKSKGTNDVDFGEEGLKGLSLTSEEIQAALSETDRPADEEDVNASIDALRPQAPVLEQSEYDHLIKELLDSYNVRQLSRYLRRSLSSKESLLVHRRLSYSTPWAKGKRHVTFTRSRWQPGRTPLDKRRISEISSPQGASLPPKARAAERIVRVAWQVAIDMEEQQIGELEMKMASWQISLFFDLLTAEQRPKFESLIQPPLLLRNAEVRPYRRDGIVRITARRQDAEDIASQLENSVLKTGKLLVDLDSLVPWHKLKTSAAKSLKNFRKDNLDMISQRTQSVLLQQADGKVGIFSYNPADRYNARRLLLGLLDLPSRNVHSLTIPIEGTEEVELANSAQKPLALVPVFAGEGLHFRHRFKSFSRATRPLQRKPPAAEKANVPATQPVASFQSRADSASRVLAPLVHQNKKQKEISKDSTFWGTYERSSAMAIADEDWNVQLGQLLQEAVPETDGNLLRQAEQKCNGTEKDSNKYTLLRNVPGFETLLSYFTPTMYQSRHKNDKHRMGGQGDALEPPQEMVARSSRLVAHLYPSPFTSRGVEALDEFPRLELVFARSWGSKHASKELRVDSMRAVVNEEIVNVPLPDATIDLRLHRRVNLRAPKASLDANAEIQEFARLLNASAQAGSHLYGKNDITVPMPSWISWAKSGVDKRSPHAGDNDLAIPYLFDRFEQTQTTTLYPNEEALSERAQHSTAIEQFKDSLPEGAFLRYKEVDAGAIGGRQTEISLAIRHVGDSPPRAKVTTGEDEIERNRTVLDFYLTPALAVADLVTRACKGEILAWRPKRPVTEDDTQQNSTSVQQVEDEMPANIEQSGESDPPKVAEPLKQEDNVPAISQEIDDGDTQQTPKHVHQETEVAVYPEQVQDSNASWKQ